ncbi:conserved protein of unknown function [Ectopseudomonas oleovorans]|uniref:Uncharacterized protein n=1 Tax=Ectopseudomonas oleovorans TaxID=301 RepID=A0A653B0C0_ECTOL|nr:conserved protein of unknown function [Pseudomonas oleovorans]
MRLMTDVILSTDAIKSQMQRCYTVSQP